MATATERTRNVEGPDGTPHRFTFDDFVRLGEIGLLPTRSELVDGEVFDLRPKGEPHYFAAFALQRQLIHADRGRYVAGPGPTLQLDDANAPMPDILVTPRGKRVSSAAAELVVEVADSSLNYDRGEKRRRYAKAKIREYWVLDVNGEMLERYLPAGAPKPTISSGRRRTGAVGVPRRRNRSRRHL